MQCPVNRSKKKLKTKICQFPGCTVEFQGIGPSKYCKEHKKQKYRNELNRLNSRKKKEKDKKQILINNQFIKHDNHYSTQIELTCALEGCDNTFQIKLLPRTFIYPKFCETHRNEYKRKLFVENRQKNI